MKILIIYLLHTIMISETTKIDINKNFATHIQKIRDLGLGE